MKVDIVTKDVKLEAIEDTEEMRLRIREQDNDVSLLIAIGEDGVIKIGVGSWHTQCKEGAYHHEVFEIFVATRKDGNEVYWDIQGSIV